MKTKRIKNTKKKITFVLVAGFLLMAADLAMSSGHEIKVEGADEQLYLIRPEAGEKSGYLSLQAEIMGEEGVYKKNIDVMVEPYEAEKTDEEDEASEETSMTMTEEERLDYSLRSIVDTINSDSSVKKIGLPASLDTGEEIKWKVVKEHRTNTLPIALMMVIISVLLYRERFASIRKKEAEDKNNVIRQLPGFINRLVLLLNAGLVLTSAFEKAVEESISTDRGENDYFYRNIKGIYISMKTANGSMHKELRHFARKSGVQELMRISNIISDNINKGAELSDKLRSEGELLWMERKKRCEEMGRLAETKLTLPLMLFLLVLIIITVTPALLEL